MRGIFLIIIIFSGTYTAFSQKGHKERLKADKKYLKNDYQQAEELYRKSAADEQNSKSLFNLGNSIYQQEGMKKHPNNFPKAASWPQII